MRWSEVAGLRIGRIDFLRHTLAVVETCAEVSGEVTFADVKSKSSRRTLDVPPFLLAMLAEHLARRDRPEPDEARPCEHPDDVGRLRARAAQRRCRCQRRPRATIWCRDGARAAPPALTGPRMASDQGVCGWR